MLPFLFIVQLNLELLTRFNIEEVSLNVVVSWGGRGKGSVVWAKASFLFERGWGRIL